jgi:mannose-6-phosphate isomerase
MTGEPSKSRDSAPPQVRPRPGGSGDPVPSVAEELYVLRFHPIFQPRIWGGDSLRKLGKNPPRTIDGKPVGESWEIADLDAVSAQAQHETPVHSVVANGPLAGQSLSDLIQRYGRALVGSVPLGSPPHFPLLIKFLDARTNLSVQVHPDRLYAAAHPGVFVKDEAWYIVDAQPDAFIYKGLRPGTTPGQLREAIYNDTIRDLLNHVPVKPGDCHYLRSGTCHALGAGILVAEVQTTSDTTFRVYDWGRGRELHVEQALACINFNAPAAPREPAMRTFHNGPSYVEQIMRCGSFTIDRATAPAGSTLPVRPVGEPLIWIVVSGAGRITADASGQEHPVSIGHTLLFPALMQTGDLRVDADMTWLEVRRPH